MEDCGAREAPSQRRLDEAREKGQLVASREVGTFLLFAAAALGCLSLAPESAATLAAIGRGFLAEAATLRLEG